MDNQIEENTYKYELELRKIVHEYIHILYNECVRQENEHFTWMDEGIAMNLSKEKGRFVKEKFPILKQDINSINLNDLSHENGNFVTQKLNGYDVSYLAVKYLIEMLSKEKFSMLIRDSKAIKQMRGDSLAASKNLF
ncbi:MAG: hypothetical protein Q4C11_02300 [Clostridium sp.]|nr:hypothetical protein [Clostridium sp.]